MTRRSAASSMPERTKGVRGRTTKRTMPITATGAIVGDEQQGGYSPHATISKSVGASTGDFVSFKQTERSFMAQVIRYAELMGWRVWHDRATNAPRSCPKCHEPIRLPRNDPGFPDLVLTRRPRVVWVELKGQRTPVTDDQRAWLAELRACGQEVYLWRPSDWPRIEELLR